MKLSVVDIICIVLVIAVLTLGLGILSVFKNATPKDAIVQTDRFQFIQRFGADRLVFFVFEDTETGILYLNYNGTGGGLAPWYKTPDGQLMTIKDLKGGK